MIREPHIVITGIIPKITKGEFFFFFTHVQTLSETQLSDSEPLLINLSVIRSETDSLPSAYLTSGYSLVLRAMLLRPPGVPRRQPVEPARLWMRDSRSWPPGRIGTRTHNRRLFTWDLAVCFNGLKIIFVGFESYILRVIFI